MHTVHLIMAAVLVVIEMSAGSSRQVEVRDAVSASRREMSIRDWMSYYSSGDRGDSLLSMTVEFSRSKLEKCLELPEIVCFAFCIRNNIAYTELRHWLLIGLAETKERALHWACKNPVLYFWWIFWNSFSKVSLENK